MAERRWEIGICGTFDVANYGDLLFPLIAESELTKRLGAVTLHRFSSIARTPPEWPYEVTAVSELPRMIHRLDGLLIGGGFPIRFDKQVAPGYVPPTPEIHHPTGDWLTPAFIALQHDVPLIWNAPGMHCNEIPRWAHTLWERALTLSRYVAVRDEPSRSALADLTSASFTVVPDTAFRLPQLMNLDGAPSAEFRRLSADSGLNRPYIVVQATLGLGGFVRFLRNHQERFRDFQFLALPIGPVLGERHEIIDADLPGVVRLTEWPSPLVIAELLGRSEAVVGHSYRLMITALASGVPVFTRQNLSTGKYSALQHFETIFVMPPNGEPDIDWFLDRVGKAAPSASARATYEPLGAHWDRIEVALRAEAEPTSHALSRFWQSLPTVLEDGATREEAAGTALSQERAHAPDHLLELLAAARSEAVVTQKRPAESIEHLSEWAKPLTSKLELLSGRSAQDVVTLRAELQETKDRQRQLLFECEVRDRTIQDSVARSTVAEERTAVLATEAKELNSAPDAANGRYLSLEHRGRSLEDRESQLCKELTQKQEQLSELSTQVVHLRAVVKVQENQLTSLRASLQKAEEIRKLTLNRCHQFRTTFEEQLSVYQGQRAWQLMLWFRKAYTLFFSSPVIGRIRFGQFALASLFGKGALSDHELAFPSLPAYMPEEIMHSFTTIADSPAGASAPLEPSQVGSDSQLPLFPHPTKYDVVILGIVDFDSRFQRPQQLAVQFAREGHRVFWISPTRHLSPAGSRRYEVLELRENIWEIHIRGQQHEIYRDSLTASAAQDFHEELAEFYRDAGIVESCVIVQLPFWRQLALGLRTSFGATVLYDCMDDWDTFPGFGPFNLSEERMLACEADVLIVTAQRLVEKFEQLGLKPLLVRNAADFESFSEAKLERSLLGGVPRPIIGYFGAIADWMDLNLVYDVALLRPDYSFVLIGKVFGRDVSRLHSLPNVHLLGHKEYVEIPSYLREFDACTIPFVVNQVTNATDPVKLYEYFSQGKAVVATPMAELEAWRDLVYLAQDAKEFAERLDHALGEETDLPSQRRIEFARSNTWRDRYATIDGAVARTFPLVSILIVTYNSHEFLQPCLDSILRNTAYPNVEIIVVDNASQDETPSIVKGYAAEQSRIAGFCLSENLGFAGGNNFAAKHASGEYLVFLNADTLVTAGWLENLLRHFRKDEAIGLLTAVTNFAGNEIKINVDYENQTEMEEFAVSLTRTYSGREFEIEVAPLYCALMPRRVWECVGHLDENFAVGMFEDDDLSMRVRAAGFRVVVAEDCFIHHFGQGSFSKLDAEEYQRVFNQNLLLYQQKWQTTWKAHKPREGVRPAHEEERFQPRSFCNGATSKFYAENADLPLPLQTTRSSSNGGAVNGDAAPEAKRQHSATPQR